MYDECLNDEDNEVDQVFEHVLMLMDVRHLVLVTILYMWGVDPKSTYMS